MAIVNAYIKAREVLLEAFDAANLVHARVFVKIRLEETEALDTVAIALAQIPRQ
jgi:hypothetical protein